MFLKDYDGVRVSIPFNDEPYVQVPPPTGGDDSEIIQSSLNEGAGGKVILPPMTYKISKTLYVPENTIFEGFGVSSKIKILTNNLDEIPFRDFEDTQFGITPLITNERKENGETTSGVCVKNLSVSGEGIVTETRIAGILFADAKNCQTENVYIEKINWDPDHEGTDYRGFNLVCVRSDNIRFTGGALNESGYECLGVYDDSSNVIVNGVFIGTGKRCSAQLHRNAKGIVFEGNILKQERTGTGSHGCFLVHGNKDMPAEDIILTNNYMECSDASAVISMVEFARDVSIHGNHVVGGDVIGIRLSGENHSFSIKDNKIKVGSKYGFRIIHLDGISSITGNSITTDYRGMYFDDVGYVNLSGNIVKSVEFGIGIKTTGGRGVIMNNNIIDTPGDPFASDYESWSSITMRDNITFDSSI